MDNPFQGALAAPQPLTDPELEQALLALLFADNGNFGKLGALQPEDLSDTFLASSFALALDIHGEGRPVNLITLKSRLDGVPLADGTGLDALRRLSVGESLPPMGEIAKRLRALSRRRSVASRLREIASVADDETQNLATLAAQAMGTLNDYVAEDVESMKTEFALSEASDEFIEWLQSGDAAVEISTGLKDLDEATGGWHRGEFAIMAGRPSMGKSACALASALRTAKSGVGVLFFSLEMTKRQIVARALTDFGYQHTRPMAYFKLKPSMVQPYDIDILYKTSEMFHDLPIEFETKPTMSMGEIIARTQRAKEDFKARGIDLGLVIVDHMLKVKPSERYAGNPVKEIDEVSAGMCVLAKSLNVAALGLHQLNRGVESRDNQRPVLSDLRGSGSLEQDADAVFFVYRPAYPYERQMQEDKEMQADVEIKLALVKHDLEIQIAKQRNGPTKTLEFFVDMQSNVVRDKDFHHSKPPALRVV